MLYKKIDLSINIIKRLMNIKYFAFLFFIISFYLQIENSQFRLFSDTNFYLNIAKNIHSLSDLFFEKRPLLSIILFYTFKNNIIILSYFQSIVYVTAWILLFLVLERLIINRMIYHTSLFVGIYLALYPDITLWTFTALTDSLNISLVVLFSSFFLLYIFNGKLNYLYVALLILIFLSFLRDANIYLLLYFAFIITYVMYTKNEKYLTIFFTVMALMSSFFFANYSANHSGKNITEARWYFNMLNNIGVRVLPNENFKNFYSLAGMPINKDLILMSGKYAHENNGSFFQNPQLQDFRVWLYQHGKKTYSELLLTHPYYSINSLCDRSDEIFHHNHFATKYYLPVGFKHQHILRIELIYFYALLFILTSITLILSKQNKNYFFAWIAIGFLVLIFYLSFILFHADAMEVARHTLQIPLFMMISILYNFAFIAKLLEQRKERRL